jgi:hypothetical protein
MIPIANVWSRGIRPWPEVPWLTLLKIGISATSGSNSMFRECLGDFPVGRSLLFRGFY